MGFFLKKFWQSLLSFLMLPSYRLDFIHSQYSIFHFDPTILDHTPSHHTIFHITILRCVFSTLHHQQIKH